jgi:hypothetical protein
MSKEIYEWLKSKNYQTEEGETGEYTMYFSVDMPKILEEYATILLKAQEEKHKEEMEKAFESGRINGYMEATNNACKAIELRTEYIKNHH